MYKHLQEVAKNEFGWEKPYKELLMLLTENINFEDGEFNQLHW